MRRARGNLITPSRTRPPVGARLVVPTHCAGAQLAEVLGAIESERLLSPFELVQTYWYLPIGD